METDQGLASGIRAEEMAFEKMRMTSREKARWRLIESYFWLVAALVMSGGIILGSLENFTSPILVISDHYMEFVLATLLLVFPTVFKLIFGALPLESMRRKYLYSNYLPEYLSDNARQVSTLSVNDFDTKALENSPAVKLFSYYAHSSKELSKIIFNRAGVYLLIGVLVAFSGLIVFYTQTGQIVLAGDGGWQLLLLMAPKFGILFFIEIVAFFFLRQYRSAMDEFRYYEAIKRSREETLALIRMAEDAGQPINPLEWVKNESFFSTGGVLEKGQTSEILESRKLEKNELDLLEKVIDVVSRSKK